MQTIDVTRRQRLLMLLQQYKTQGDFNEAIGLDRTDASISQIKNQSAHHQTKKPRTMGDDMARRIEEHLDLPRGWMDTPPIADQNTPVAKAVTILNAMEPEAQYQAVRLLDALTQPKVNTGT